MKHCLLLLSLTLLTVNFGYAQEDIKDAKDTGERKDYNKWTIELTAGQSKGTKPFTVGYYSSNPDKLFGSVKFNTFSLGVRYMFSAKFGLKADISSDLFTNNKNTDSKDFKLQQYRFGLQGVVNASRLFNIQQELGRLSILIHAGLQAARATPKYKPDEGVPGYFYNKSELNLGVMFGISPEVRVSKKFSIIGDFSTLSNFRQHFTWDGRVSDKANNLSGQMIMSTLGLTYSFGNDNIHGDWAIIDEGKLKEIEALDKRIGDLESMLNDTDKDGVPDYLDVENNSIAGVAVDTKGRMVDINKNGIPDELEKFMANTYVDKSNIKETLETANADMIKRLINEGYVTTYFDSGKTVPTNVSTEGIDFIRTYLKNNPNASVDIVGHADEIGKSAYNDKLAASRANTVKNTLMKAGIPESRLNIISEGEDASVAVDSKDARRLVRRVTFKVKD
ncbi:OmpA family protein [Flavobacterium sp.]|uniref:OmpA family protein n=1 Tax=Flavobacterium sp. TaxID=239 RepID=UPI00260F04C1|nr:OmpA family protein [Flavobacterium sp.]